MPYGGFGVSFVPGQAEQSGQNGRGLPEGANPVQQAIQMLSLRLPRIVGPGGISAQSLLTAPGGIGQTGTGGINGAGMSPLLQALLRLAGLSGPSLSGPSLSGPSLSGPSLSGPSQSNAFLGTPPIHMDVPPIPRIIPGDRGPRLPGPSLPLPPSGPGPLPGPGVPTFPGVPDDSSFIDRRNPGPGNRGDGSPVFRPRGAFTTEW